MAGSTPSSAPSNAETATNKIAAASGMEGQKESSRKDTLNVLKEAEERMKEFTTIYGKSPSEEFVLQKHKDSGGDIFKGCKTYQDVLKIRKEGLNPAKNDTRGQNTELHYRLQKNALSQAKIEEESKDFDFEAVYGKTPTEAGVFKILKEKYSAYKDAKNFDEAMKILKERRPPAYKYITEHLSPRHPLQDADDKTIDKDLAERGFTPDGKVMKPETTKTSPAESQPADSKPEVKPEIKSEKSRWTAEDEANRPGSKTTPKVDTPKEAKEPKEKIEKVKKERHFRRSTRNTIKWPFKTLNKMRRTVGRTLAAPTYFLADFGQEKKTGAKDLGQGYKDIRTGKKAA